MAIFIYLNILLSFLVNLFGIVFMVNKRSHNDISSDSNNEYNDNDKGDSDNTPTNEKNSEEGDITPNETINDITNVKHTLEQVKRLARGEDIDKKDLDSIKEEYESFFDEDSGNTTEKESLNQIIEYLEGELSTSLNKASLAGLNEALDEILKEPSQKSSEGTYQESINKKAKTSEASSTKTESAPESSFTNTENAPSGSTSVDAPQKKPSDGLSPLDHVLEKQGTEPISPEPYEE
jgi:hypothetical protein